MVRHIYKYSDASIPYKQVFGHIATVLKNVLFCSYQNIPFFFKGTPSPAQTTWQSCSATSSPGTASKAAMECRFAT